MKFVETTKRKSAGVKVCLLRFRIEYLRKVQRMWFLAAFQYDFHSQYLLHVKGKLLLKDILGLKMTSCLRPLPLARNRTKQIQWNLNCSVVEASEIFSQMTTTCNYTRSLTHFLIYSSLNLNRPFGDRELLPSVCLVSPQRRTGELKKEDTYSAVGGFTIFWWHLESQNRVGRRRNKMDQIDKGAIQNKTLRPD